MACLCGGIAAHIHASPEVTFADWMAHASLWLPPSTLLWLLTGIWTRDLKSRTNLQQAQITKVLKQLETRRLVKSIRPVSEPSKKFYISFDIEPSTEITGGAWWVVALPSSRAVLMWMLVLRRTSLQYAVLLALPSILNCVELQILWCWGVLLPRRSKQISHHPEILQGCLVQACCPVLCAVSAALV